MIFAGSLPRDVPDDFYAQAIHDLARRYIPSALDTEGEPLRLGIEAEPFLVTPNQAEAEALVGQEFHDDDDFVLGPRPARRPGRSQRPHHDRGRLLRPPARGPDDRRYRVEAPRVEAVSRVGSGDTFLAAFVAAWEAGRGHEEALREGSRPAPPRRSSSAPAASILARLCRLQAGVTVAELEQVSV